MSLYAMWLILVGGWFHIPSKPTKKEDHED